MDKKLFSLFLIFFVATIFSVAFLLLFTGCGIFGGGGKEAPKIVETPPAKPTAPAVSQPETPKPLPAAVPSDSQFQTDELDYEVKMVNGSLNWSKGVIRAKGYGVPPDDAINPQQGKLLAFKAAHDGALANLIEITEGVQVTATTTVENYMAKNHTIKTEVEAKIKGAIEISREFQEEDQTAVVEMGIFLENVAVSIPKGTLPFDEAVHPVVWDGKEDETLRSLASDNKELLEPIETSASLDEIKQKLQEIAEENKTLADKNKELLATIEKLNKEIEALKESKKPIDTEQTYTGIVIKAAGSGIKPSMTPSIYYRSEDTDKLLYGINDGRKRDANVHALVAW
ncbi:MAG: hypothetical protein ACE5PV_14170, partial [Candidatus Poribacteria bacterium]